MYCEPDGHFATEKIELQTEEAPKSAGAVGGPGGEPPPHALRGQSLGPPAPATT